MENLETFKQNVNNNIFKEQVQNNKTYQLTTETSVPAAEQATRQSSIYQPTYMHQSCYELLVLLSE